MDITSHKLKRELGLLELFCIASGAMISSGLFVLPGLAFAGAGPSVILAYLLAAILMLPTLLSKAELATAMPKVGGNYFFTSRSMGPGMGTLGGFADWFSLSFKASFALLGIGIFILLFDPGFTEMQIKLVAVVCCLFFALVNIVGVKLAGRFQVVLVVALLALLAFYVIFGAFFIQFHRFTPFMPLGLGAVFSTVGLIFISYGGLTKVVAIAEEVKNPGRNLPLAMLLAWFVVSLLYVLVVFITVGLVDSAQLQTSLIPISDGASTFLGREGSLILGLAALVAFITTANAGILATSRIPMAMSKDKLFLGLFEKISKRGTPVSSIIFTSGFMVFAILLLDLEVLVKAASTMILLVFVFLNLSVIFMRESKIRHYQPKFRSPLYPWVQILGIIGGFSLISIMGAVPLLIVSIFLGCVWGWYWFYARGKTKRDYALLHVVGRITGIKLTSSHLDEELKEIRKERDELT